MKIGEKMLRLCILNHALGRMVSNGPRVSPVIKMAGRVLKPGLRLTVDGGMRLRGMATRTGSGFQQANLVILHKSLADDFEEFCRANSGPLPLLYRSQPGEWACPTLAKDTDIRTDCAQYCVFENGRLTSRVPSLMAFAQPMQDMVSFYLGCSFSFEQNLQVMGVPIRNVEQSRSVSMYRTSLPCHAVGEFRCPMVVSMRPVPEQKLDAAAQVSHLTPMAHGAPVHIGDPALIGIPDLSRPDYGEAVDPVPGDVPVFWACGVTGLEAVQSVQSSLAFTHAPGCMFLCDRETPPTTVTSDPEQRPLAYRISQQPLNYSLVSEATVKSIQTLEQIIGEDPGERGIQALFVQDELLKSCLSLSHASSVLITTGFPTHFMHSPPEENDGPPGAIAMAAALQALGKDVALVIDHRALEMNVQIMQDAVKKGLIKTAVPLLSFQTPGQEAALHFLCHDGDPQRPRFDHLVAIERSGRAADGNYYNMRGVNIKHLVDPIDDLFTAASAIAGIATTGIGDGGNELGMGKVRDAVRAHMPNGSLIACDVAADFAITAGVSNWGGYAVACALYLLSTCPVHERYLRRGIGFPPVADRHRHWANSLPSVSKEEHLLAILMKYGIRSGKSGNLAMEVDALPFHPTHSTMIQRLSNVTLKPRPSLA